jgi:outer membrane protein
MVAGSPLMLIKRIIHCCLLLFSLHIPVSAQQDIQETMITMEEAMWRALHKNNQLKASEYAVQGANWAKKNAWTQLFPTVSLSTQYTWIDDSTFVLRDFSRYFQDPNLPFQIPQTVFQNAFFTAINVSMPVFNPMLLNNISRANISADRAEYLSLSTRRTIIFEVIRSYLRVLKSREIYEIQKEYLDLSKLNYEKGERLYQAGRYSKTDAMRWQVDLQQQQSIVTTSQSDLRSAKIILSRLLNADRNQFFEVENRIPVSLLDESGKLLKLNDIELLNLIQLDNEELLQANAALAAAKKSEQMSESDYRNTFNAYLPQINLTYSYAWRENASIALDDYSPKTLVINLTVPLFTSFKNFTQLKSSYYDYKQSQEIYYDQLLNIRFVLTQTINKLINLKTQKELSKISVEFNERNYRIIEQQKEKGLVSNIEFIDAKLNFQDAQLTDISNYYDFITGMVELYYLLGKIEQFVEQRTE